MSEPKIALLNLSNTSSGEQIVGNGAKTVFLDDQPIALEGSTTSGGTSAIQTIQSRQVYAEDKKIAYEGDIFADGTSILTGASSS